MGVPPIGPWQNEHRIDVLLNNHAVRFRIEQATQSSSRPMSFEQFVTKSSGVMWAIPGMHVAALFPLAALAGRQMWKALGVHVERAKSMTYHQAIGQVTVSVLCALARSGYPIQRTVQRDDGCILEAKLPSTWKYWGGTIACTVRSRFGGTEVKIVITIPGQLGDVIGMVEKEILAILNEVRRYAESL
jgi:hypothetical protein